MHLWDASERVWVLNIRFRSGCYLAALKQFEHSCCGVELSLVRTHHMNGLGEWREQSVVSVERHCGNSVCPVAQPLALKQRPNGESTHVLSTVEQGETLFRTQLYRLPVHLLQYFSTCHHLAFIFHFTESDERQCEVCQRHEVAGSSERALHIYYRIDVVVEEVDEALHGVELRT